MSIICPKYESSNLTSTIRGFSAGKAVAGGLLFGSLGTLAGTHGSSKVKIACLNAVNLPILQRGRMHNIVEKQKREIRRK